MLCSFGRHLYCTVRNFRQCYFSLSFFSSLVLMVSCSHVSLNCALPVCAWFNSISSLLRTRLTVVFVWLTAFLGIGGSSQTHTQAKAHRHTRRRYIIKFRYQTVNREIFIFNLTMLELKSFMNASSIMWLSIENHESKMCSLRTRFEF